VRAKAVAKRGNSKSERLQVGPAEFRRVYKGIPYERLANIFPRFYYADLAVPNPVVIRGSLDKFCLEKGQSRNRFFVKHDEQGCTQAANPDSQQVVVPVKKNRLATKRAGREN
jgi:hypothetical protein